MQSVNGGQILNTTSLTALSAGGDAGTCVTVIVSIQVYSFYASL